MSIAPDMTAMRRCLDEADLRTLFVEHLGWDHQRTDLSVVAGSSRFGLAAVARKRGTVVLVCSSPTLPDEQARRTVQRHVSRVHHENIVVFVTGDKSEQRWQWVSRKEGRPPRFREFAWRKGMKSGQLLERALPALATPLEEEDRLTQADLNARAVAAFDVEKVTRRFFERFQAEHTAFHKFVDGITDKADRDWYASVMLNRLMFCYFIQKKGLLNGDQDYLRDRLQKLQQSKGKDKFWSFYRHFLLRLFHEGLSVKPNQRSKDLDALIGKIPYLNGGLFLPHDLEEKYKADIQIPDKAFERIFAFFDEYRWHLDERPLRENNEINPDVLGYIFEKYINQKQMGAYYTKEDITGYISQNTIIPFILDQAAKNCAVAFSPLEGQHAAGSVWRLLKGDPDRYIYPAVRQGVIDANGAVTALPREVEAGIKDVSKRGGWNRSAAEPFALPTETWREHVARRERCLELRRKLGAGEITTVNDLVTLNLDIRQFAEDVIDNCEGPELLRSIWKAVESVTVLDPTCGSGAFLFAALNILEPLYEACLDRMGWFMDSLAREAAAGTKPHPEKFSDFRKVLARIEDHPNRRYFILKSIIVNNLFGVDIMEEACEICKLRLFLKLVAQVEEGAIEKIEPLPDIDFNIRAGNTLVGYSTLASLRDAFSDRLDFGKEVDRVQLQAEAAAVSFQRFRDQQTRHGMEPEEFFEGKQLLRERLTTLDRELDAYLASEYEVAIANPEKLRSWLDSHEPFHWFVDFYGIMATGGFSVIIGNPPWVEYSKVRKTYRVRNYATEKCGNLHGLCTERCLGLLAPDGRMSFIVQMPLVSSSRMQTVRRQLVRNCSSLWVATFDDRPGKLFDGLQHCRSTIFLAQRASRDKACTLAVTRYHRWPTTTRPTLFARVQYVDAQLAPWPIDCFPKISNADHRDVLNRLSRASPLGLGHCVSTRSDSPFVFYQEATQYWVKATVGLPHYRKNGKKGAPAHGRAFALGTGGRAHAASAVMNSTLFYLFYVTFSDCFHLSDTVASAFPIPSSFLDDSELSVLGQALQRDLVANAQKKTIATKAGDSIEYAEFFCVKSRPMIDQIDRRLGQLYGIPPGEIDAVLGYDASLRDSDSDASDLEDGDESEES